MSRKKWTAWYLSDAALRILSQIVHQRDRHGHGMALAKLVDCGLVEWDPQGAYPRTYLATDAGREALRQARAEGW